MWGVYSLLWDTVYIYIHYIYIYTHTHTHTHTYTYIINNKKTEFVTFICYTEVLFIIERSTATLWNNMIKNKENINSFQAQISAFPDNGPVRQVRKTSRFFDSIEKIIVHEHTRRYKNSSVIQYVGYRHVALMVTGVLWCTWLLMSVFRLRSTYV